MELFRFPFTLGKDNHTIMSLGLQSSTIQGFFLQNLISLNSIPKRQLMATPFVLNDDPLDNVSKLKRSQRYINIMQQAENSLYESKLGCVIDDPEQLIINCHALSIDIENEIVLIHNFIRDNYGLKSSELEPNDYAPAVENTVDDLELLLPSAIIIVFSCWLHGKTIEARDRAHALYLAKKKLLDFIESRMGYIAPNLSVFVRRAVAAKLIASAGGLSSLANIRFSEIIDLGGKTKISSVKDWGVGAYIEQSEILIQSIPPPPALRLRACGIVALQLKSVARIDSTRGCPTGKFGTASRERLRKMLRQM